MSAINSTPVSPPVSPSRSQKRGADSPPDHTSPKKIIRRSSLNTSPIRAISIQRISSPGLSAQFSAVRLQPPHYQFLQGTSPSLASLVERCDSVLARAHGDFGAMHRMLPESTGELTASGSYFVREEDGSRALVVKPTNQEAGSKDSPNGPDALRLGINPGQSAIRERLAYKTQELLGVDCGIPPVCLTLMRHEFFLECRAAEVRGAFSRLRGLKVIDGELAFLELAVKANSSAELCQQLRERALAPLMKGLVSDGVPRVLLPKIRAFCDENRDLSFTEQLPKCREQFGAYPWFTNVTSGLRRFLTQTWELKKLPGHVDLLWSHYRHIQETERPSFVSAQRYIPDANRTLEDLNITTEVPTIPAEEFCKLAIEIVLLDTDRGLSNILVRQNPETGEFKLVLIDHGYALPNPLLDSNCDGLKQTVFEFLDYNQARQPLKGPVAEAIKRIDIEALISGLKTDQLAHMMAFQDFKAECTVPEEVYHLIRFNLTLLKIGMQLGKSMREIASVQAHTKESSRDGSGRNGKPFFTGGEITWALPQSLVSRPFGKPTFDYSRAEEVIRGIFAKRQVGAEPPWEDPMIASMERS